MSNSRQKAEDLYFWEQNSFEEKFQEAPTKKQAIKSLYELALKYKFSDEDLEEVKEITKTIRKTGL